MQRRLTTEVTESTEEVTEKGEEVLAADGRRWKCTFWPL